MKFEDLEARLATGRRFEVELEGAAFTIKLPSDHAWKVAADEHGQNLGAIKGTGAAYRRHMLELALVDWRGVTDRHFMPEGPGEPVAFTPQARRLLLDERQDLSDQLEIELMRRTVERRRALEDAKKN